MSDDTLSPEERAVLLVLTALGTEVSNPQLKERFGAEIRKPVRTRLEQLKLIGARKGLRGAIFHEVSDTGWARAAGELTGELPRGHRLTAAAATLLATQLHSYLVRADLRLAEVFVLDPALTDGVEIAAEEPAPVSDVPAEAVSALRARVRDAYRSLAPRANALVKLADVRAALADVTTEDLDAELRRLARVPGVTLVPESNQKTLTEVDRAAAIRVGNQNKHLLAMED